MIYTKSDLQFMHLLAKRGLSFEYSLDTLNKEKVIKRSNGNLRSILRLFCRVSELESEEIRTSTDKHVIWVKHMFCYYCRKNTDITNKCIGDYINICQWQVTKATQNIQCDYDVKYKPTIKFLKTIKNETLKTKKI